MYNYLKVSIRHALGQKSITPSLDFERDNAFAFEAEQPSSQQPSSDFTGGGYTDEQSPIARDFSTERDENNLENWEKIYSEFFIHIFQTLNTKNLYDVTMGTFRMNKDYFNRINCRNPESDIFYSEYVNEKNTVALPKNIRSHIMEKLKQELSKYIVPKKILVWD